mgnify:CR=1 FL=1
MNKNIQSKIVDKISEDISPTRNLKGHHLKIVLGIAIVLLIGAYIMIYFTLVDNVKKWPPTVAKCPDYWVYDDKEKKCIIPMMEQDLNRIHEARNVILPTQEPITPTRDKDHPRECSRIITRATARTVHIPIINIKCSQML